MKFSIIIPMYNVQGYIHDCLNSIFEQEFENYELILVDDGSDDNTLDVARRAIKDANKEPITTIIEKDNSGASATRNAGLKVAKGEFIIFMDADDLMTNYSLNAMNEATEQQKADLYVFSLKKEVDGFICESELSKIDNFHVEEENGVRCLEKYLEKTDYIITWQPWSKVFRKSIIDKKNIEFDTSLFCCNDFNFFMKYILNTQSVFFSNTPTTIYRVDRPGSISITKLERRLQSSTKAYSEMFYRIKDTGFRSPLLLEYMSYLFLCSFDIASHLKQQQLSKIDNIVSENQEVYKYSRSFISKLRRTIYKIFGYNTGAKLILFIQKCSSPFRAGNSII